METTINMRNLLWQYSQQLALSILSDSQRLKLGQYGTIGACLCATPEQRVDALLSLLDILVCGFNS
jgi:hypothetical protein